MSVVLTGSSGQLGRCIQDELNVLGISYHALSKEDLPIEDKNKVNRIFKKLLPSIVLNAAAYTNVDSAEDKSDLAYSINATGPENLAYACNNLEIPLVHISTDFVFNGKSKVKYLPKDKTDPISVYGKSKLKGEENIIRICKKFVIIRTSWVFSIYGKNFLKTILKLAQTKTKINVIDDQIGSPTDARDLAKAIVKNLDSFHKVQNQNKIFHYSGDKSCSWYEFAKSIVHNGYEMGIIKKLPELNPIKTEEFKQNIAERPRFSALDSQKFCNRFNVSASDWKSSISKAIKELSL